MPKFEIPSTWELECHFDGKRMSGGFSVYCFKDRETGKSYKVSVEEQKGGCPCGRTRIPDLPDDDCEACQ